MTPKAKRPASLPPSRTPSSFETVLAPSEAGVETSRRTERLRPPSRPRRRRQAPRRTAARRGAQGQRGSAAGGKPRAPRRPCRAGAPRGEDEAGRRSSGEAPRSSLVLSSLHGLAAAGRREAGSEERARVAIAPPRRRGHRRQARALLLPTRPQPRLDEGQAPRPRRAPGRRSPTRTTGPTPSLVGRREKGAVRYLGTARWGVRRDELRTLLSAATGMARRTSPFANLPRRPGALWLEPRLAVEVTHAGLVRGKLRDPVLRRVVAPSGLRCGEGRRGQRG
jgi:hypothetical protein